MQLLQVRAEARALPAGINGSLISQVGICLDSPAHVGKVDNNEP